MRRWATGARDGQPVPRNLLERLLGAAAHRAARTAHVDRRWKGGCTAVPVAVVLLTAPVATTACWRRPWADSVTVTMAVNLIALFLFALVSMVPLAVRQAAHPGGTRSRRAWEAGRPPPGRDLDRQQAAHVEEAVARRTARGEVEAAPPPHGHAGSWTQTPAQVLLHQQDLRAQQEPRGGRAQPPRHQAGSGEDHHGQDADHGWRHASRNRHVLMSRREPITSGGVSNVSGPGITVMCAPHPSRGPGG